MPWITRKIKIGLTAAAAVIALCWIARCIYRSCVISEYQRELLEKGFPKSYAERLAELQLKHQSWVFVPVPVADLTWNEIIEKELSPSWNLVACSDWAPDEWKSLGRKNYTPYYAENAKAYDSGVWYQASRETIAYFMDPRNWMNKHDIFMFETLGFDKEYQTLEAVEKTLAGTFMANAKCGGADGTFAELLMDVGSRLKISPVFLAGRLASEQGLGSPQSLGTIGNYLIGLSTNQADKIGDAVIWGKRFTRDGEATKAVLAKDASAYNGYYNFFNFRAYGLGLFEIKYNAWFEATSDETREKYLGPWDTQARAIEGGSLKIKERYIDTHRHTRYFQKFSVLHEAGEFRWKQYMQNIAAPLAEARNTAKAYESTNTLDAPYRFLIPVFAKMPRFAAADPADGKSIYSPSR